ncbi:unnamed protein product [marine sediment metagenome]|uniref:Uncharacterized protein n=1 Tax=marine sediment metagenome TaxID=412755 RepID=X1PVF5_9ZZZZ
MVKNLFECHKCGNKWAGRPIAERKNVRTDDSNKPVIKCASCGEYAGYFISDKVPGDLLKKKSIIGKRAAEVKADITAPEKGLDDYIRLLGKAKDATSLQQGLARMSQGGEIKFEDLLKLAVLDKLNKSDNPGAVLLGIQRDIDNLRRDLADAKKSAPAVAPSPATPPYVEVLLKKIIEGYTAPHDSGGLKFNNLSELQNAAKFFTSSSGRNMLDIESEKVQAEYQAKREAQRESAKFHSDLIRSVKEFTRDMGYGMGDSFSKNLDRERDRKFERAKPISLTGTPVEGNSNLLKIPCPACHKEITYELGSARIVCPHCNDYFTVIPQEEKSRSPGGSSPSRASAHPGVESRASGDYHNSGSEKESAVVVGGRVRGGDTKVIDPGDTKKQKGGKK